MPPSSGSNLIQAFLTVGNYSIVAKTEPLKSGQRKVQFSLCNLNSFMTMGIYNIRIIELYKEFIVVMYVRT